MSTTFVRKTSIPCCFALLFLGMTLAGKAQVSPRPVSYDTLWRRVAILADSLGLVRTAQDSIASIYARARQENNMPEVIRALLNQIEIDEQTQEDPDTADIRILRAETDSLPEPARSILQSLTASAYQRYYDDHRYQLLRRVSTGDTAGDMSTWSAADFYRHIGLLYAASLKDPILLQHTPLKGYDVLLQKGNMDAARPTLYDLLVNRAVKYFSNTERDVTRPLYTFVLDDSALFAPAPVFIGHTIHSGDSASLYWKALLLYQDLLRFHRGDKNPDAFIDADLNRLDFVRRYTVLDNKDAAYREALGEVISRYPHRKGTAQAYYLLGRFYLQAANAGAETLSVDSTHKSDLNKSLVLFEHVVRVYPLSIWAPAAKSASEWIRQSEVSLQTEAVIVPGKPFLTFVKYRNTPTLRFRLIRSDSLLDKAVGGLGIGLERTRAAVLRLSSAPLYRGWVQNLPCPPDHRYHAAEAKTDALPVGSYILLASADGRFGKGTEPLAALRVSVSGIAVVSSGPANFYVVNRETGQPLPGAMIRVLDVNYKTRSEAIYRSDLNGHVKVEKTYALDYDNLTLCVNTGLDSLIVDDFDHPSNRVYSINTRSGSAPAPKPRLVFFTDRDIYRPGQTVYFKAIGLYKLKGAIYDQLFQAPGPIRFYLQAAGNRGIDSLSLQPDDFGSVHGSFPLPENRLNGWFEIRAKDIGGSTSFSVEAYKRPRFETSFQPRTAPARMGDTLQLTGKASAYAGHPIDGATVKYTVTRTAWFPNWNFRIPYPSVSNTVIVQDTTRTAADGTFTIRFPALADRSVPRSDEPYFDFRIDADVTDINGESHSARDVILVGYKALLLRLDLPDDGRVRADSLHSLSIRSLNLNGTPHPLPTTIDIVRLQTPDGMIRSRYWPKPDQFTIDKATYHRLFPHDEYQDEADMTTWPAAEKVLTATYTTGAEQPFLFDGKRLGAGVYRITVTATDLSGLPLLVESTLEVYDPLTGQMPYPAYEWGAPLQKRVKPKDTTRFVMGSGLDSVFLMTQSIRQNHRNISHRYLFPSGRLVPLSVRPGQTDPAGLTYSYAFVRDNRFFYHDLVVGPAPNPHKLTIRYTTFRNKLEPGSPETWTLSIYRRGKKAADAEVLASMYDASLDQFRASRWNLPVDNPMVRSSSWGYGGFGSMDDVKESLSRPTYSSAENTDLKSYDEIPFPYDLYNRTFADIVNRQPSIRVNGRGIVTVAPQYFATTRRVSMTAAVSVVTSFSDVPAPKPPPTAAIPLRKNFNETAFFYPDLRTDTAGNVSFSFTSPEALTTWKFRVLAHTRDLDYGLSEKETVTQKTLMLEPNLPRFFRAGDKVWLDVKVVYNGAAPVRGKVNLYLFDAITMQPVDTAFGNPLGSTVAFERGDTTPRSSSVNTSFLLHIPTGFTHPVIYRLTVAGGDFSDGEQGVIPVLSRNLLVTESTPIFVNGDSTQRLDLAPFRGVPYRLTLEYSSNPTWYVIQAIPTLLESPHECLDYTFNRYYAGAIGEGISQAIPTFAQILDAWKKDTTGPLKSAIEQDTELKSVLLEETPWVLDAAGERSQKQRLASLLDTANLDAAQTSALSRLRDGQNPDGAFPWFKGGPGDSYTTEYIVTGLGRLRRLGMETARDRSILDTLIKNAIGYLDATLKSDTILGYGDIEYLYARSYFPGQPLSDSAAKTRDLFLRIARNQWQKKDPYAQAMVALALYRSGDTITAHRILASLEETSIGALQTGRYWKNTDISAQAVLIEAFEEITPGASIINQLRTWLLAQKEARAWPSEKGTADACYAVLINRDGKATGWLASTPAVKIQLGDTIVDSRSQASSAGTGYFKRQWDGAQIHPSMGYVHVTPVREKHAVPVSWGGVYYQYFQDMDSIPPAGTALTIQKQYYVSRATGMRRVKQGDTLHVGNRVRLRLILSSDRDLDYVHLGDLRAGCMEPIDVISGYKWQGGLSYYQTTLDLSTHWYFDHLSKGTHVLEYDLFVERAGVYSGGIATLECLYAPQFSAHSQGVTVISR